MKKVEPERNVVRFALYKDPFRAAWRMRRKGRKVERDGSRKQARPSERSLSLRLAGMMGRGTESGFKSYHSGVELIGLESESNKGEGGAYYSLGFLFAISVDGGSEPRSPNWKREGSEKGVEGRDMFCFINLINFHLLIEL